MSRYSFPYWDASVTTVKGRTPETARASSRIDGAGSVGLDLQIQSAATNPYVEPPQVSYVNPSDTLASEDPLGTFRDRLCGVTRS